MLRYADDIATLMKSEEDLEAVFEMVVKGEGYNMKINKTKTIVMSCDKEEQEEIPLGSEPLKQVT